ARAHGRSSAPRVAPPPDVRAHVRGGLAALGLSAHGPSPASVRSLGLAEPEASADRSAVALAALVAGLLVGQQVAGRALRDALFLSAFAVTSLPGILLASALVSIAGALAFAALLARRTPSAVVSGVLWLQALLLGAEWGLAAEHPRLVAVALYVQLALLGPGVLSGFWSLVNERFDPHTARRVVDR